jgi:hypothetical protein
VQCRLVNNERLVVQPIYYHGVDNTDGTARCLEDVLKVDAGEEGVGGNDAADCLRYLVATKARSGVTRKLSGV